MKRRDFITLLGGATAAWPLAARAQQGERMRRIGALMPHVAEQSAGTSQKRRVSEGLQELGWTVGRNVRIEYRWSAGDAGERASTPRNWSHSRRMSFLPPAAQPWNHCSRRPARVPIVFAIVPDPVGAGIVDSLAKPGRQRDRLYDVRTGVSAKWLELLKETRSGHETRCRPSRRDDHRRNRQCGPQFRR